MLRTGADAPDCAVIDAGPARRYVPLMIRRLSSVILALAAAACAHQQRTVKVFQTCSSFGFCTDTQYQELTASAVGSDWPAYGRTPYGDRHSPLRQITPGNVSTLEVAWRFHTGEGAPEFKTRAPTALEVTPLVFRGTMYLRCDNRHEVDRARRSDRNALHGFWAARHRAASHWPA